MFVWNSNSTKRPVCYLPNLATLHWKAFWNPNTSVPFPESLVWRFFKPFTWEQFKTYREVAKIILRTPIYPHIQQFLTCCYLHYIFLLPAFSAFESRLRTSCFFNHLVFSCIFPQNRDTHLHNHHKYNSTIQMGNLDIKPIVHITILFDCPNNVL